MDVDSTWCARWKPLSTPTFAITKRLSQQAAKGFITGYSTLHCRKTKTNVDVASGKRSIDQFFYCHYHCHYHSLPFQSVKCSVYTFFKFSNENKKFYDFFSVPFIKIFRKKYYEIKMDYVEMQIQYDCASYTKPNY